MKPPLITNQLLDSLGLNEKEQAIYLSSLELGESLQLPLAEKAGIKRTTLREILPELQKKGVLELVVRGKRNYISAVNPKNLLERLKTTTQEAEQSLPALLAIQNTTVDKPLVRFYDGVEGVKEIYRLTLEVAEPIYGFVEVEAIHPLIQKWLSKEYTQKRNQKQIKAYNIVNTSSKLDSIMPSDQYRENKIVSSKEFPFQMEIIVFGEYVAYINFRETERPSATLIQSQAAAITMRSVHQLFWK